MTEEHGMEVIFEDMPKGHVGVEVRMVPDMMWEASVYNRYTLFICEDNETLAGAISEAMKMALGKDFLNP